MKKLIIVNNSKDWDFDLPEVEVIDAKSYLTKSDFLDLKNTRIFNLCRNYKYQSTGYYVSLLAEARGHKMIPNVTTLGDFKTQTIIKSLSDDIDLLIQKSLEKLKTDKFTLSIYFGNNLAKQYEKLAKSLYNLFQAPLLRAEFRFNKKWHLKTIVPISVKDISEEHKPFVESFAKSYFSKKRFDSAKVNKTTYDLAILYNPKENDPPSNKEALEKFVAAGEKFGFYVELITKEDLSRIPEFDALFIRETTAVNHHTYKFSRLALAEGLVVIDDPISMLRCTNKVFLAELLTRNKIPTPKTMIIHKENLAEVEGILGLPCVLKKPDSSFSVGVVKAKTTEELKQHLTDLLQSSDLIIGQEFLFTEFDWRIGILNKQVIYACKYHMAKDHWQIYDWSSAEEENYGGVETFNLSEVPEIVLSTSLKAANLIGEGLYGVDIKEKDDKVYIIEINDNPSIDAGFEDRLLGDELYNTIMQYFKTKLDISKHHE